MNSIKNMGSVMMNFNDQYLKKGKINVFKGNDGYKNGEQERDFVYINDCIDINIFFSIIIFQVYSMSGLEKKYI